MSESKRMKIGFITLSCAYNYGAVLQAYATQKFLSQKGGYDTILVDYVTERYQIEDKDFVYKSTVRWRKNVLTRLLWKYTKHKNELLCRDFFRNFVEEHIPKTKVYYSNEELKEDLPDCDAFISGSDQIWNTDFSWDKQPDYPFFLDFVPDDRKKIAYSSSFGEAHMSTEVRQKVKKLLERYDAIAVRETSGKNLVEDMGLSAKVVLDPTMLCDRAVWDELAVGRLVEQDYVLLFQINPNKELLYFAGEFARSQKMRLIILSANPAHRKNLGRKAIYLPKVEEWLSYFKYASYVLTDSFHACVFSVQFERQFVPVVDQRNVKRISSVLELLGIKDRTVEVDSLNMMPGVLENTVNYDDVKQKLMKLQKDSGEWLLDKLKKD